MSQRRQKSSDQQIVLAFLAQAQALRLALLSEDLLRRPASARAKRDMLECMRDLERLLKGERTAARGANVIDLPRRLRLRAICAALGNPETIPPPPAA